MLGIVKRAQSAKEVLDDVFPAVMYDDVPSAHILSQVTSRMAANIDNWEQELRRVQDLVTKARQEVHFQFCTMIT